MSQAQYTVIQQGSLTNLGRLPARHLMQWLKTKPEWMQKNIIRHLSH